MKQVQDALKNVGVPAFVGIWRATSSNHNPPDQYIVYSTTTKEEEHFDDCVVATKTFVYMNLWSKGDPTKTAALVRKTMYAAGFGMVEETDQGYNQPAYDTAARLFAVQWTWSLYKEVPLGN